MKYLLALLSPTMWMCYWIHLFMHTTWAGQTARKNKILWISISTSWECMAYLVSVISRLFPFMPFVHVLILWVGAPIFFILFHQFWCVLFSHHLWSLNLVLWIICHKVFIHKDNFPLPVLMLLSSSLRNFDILNYLWKCDSLLNMHGLTYSPSWL